MQEVRNWKLKRVIKVINQIADAKINQGVLLKEMAHSIQTHQKDKTPTEWRTMVFDLFERMLKQEQEMIK